MDLVSCRNLLIYLGSEAQHRVIPTFHYALRPGGFLFLGTSESLGQHGELFFFTVDKKNRIFQARETASNRRLPVIMGNRVNASVSGRAPPAKA
ncbi:CheR family methyltransferase [Roseibium salinum]|nr:CheR family methyltransferase [Roseibium salinum]